MIVTFDLLRTLLRMRAYEQTDKDNYIWIENVMKPECYVVTVVNSTCYWLRWKHRRKEGSVLVLCVSASLKVAKLRRAIWKEQGIMG